MDPVVPVSCPEQAVSYPSPERDRFMNLVCALIWALILHVSSKLFHFHHVFHPKNPVCIASLFCVSFLLGFLFLTTKIKTLSKDFVVFLGLCFKISFKNIHFRKLQNIGEAISRNILVSRSLMIGNLNLHTLHEMLCAWHFYAEGIIIITSRKLCVLYFLRNTSRLNWKRDLTVKYHALYV